MTVLTIILITEIMNASSIKRPITTLGDAPIALQIAISRLLSFKLENIMAVMPMSVVKITVTEIPSSRFSTTPTILHSS